MKRLNKLLVLGGVFFFVIGSHAQETLLRFSPGAKSLLLGRSGVVGIYDPSALYWNPAALNVPRMHQAILSVQEMYRLNYSAISVFFPPHGTFAFDLGRSDIGERPVEFGSLGWGGSVHPDVHLGFSLSALQIENEGWTTMGFGILYKPSMFKNHFEMSEPFYSSYIADRLTVGLAVKHIPLIISGYEHQIRTGLSYAFMQNRLQVISAFHHDRLDDVFHFGAQYELIPSFFLYAGVQDFDHHYTALGFSAIFSNFTTNVSYDMKSERLAVSALFRIGQKPNVNGEKHYEKAKNWLQKQNKRQALQEVRKAVSYQPGLEPAWDMLETLKSMVEREDQHIDSLLSVAEYFQEKEWYISAAAHYLQVLKLNPKNKPAERAIREIRPKVNVHTEKWFQTGVRQYSRGEFHKAREIFESILLVRKGHKESQKYLDKINSIFEKQAKDHYFTGLGYYSQHNLNRAEEEFRKAIRLLPTFDDALNYLNKVHIEQRQNRRQIADLIAGATRHEENNRIRQALGEYKQILEIDPGHRTALERKRSLEQAIENGIREQIQIAKQAYKNGEFKRAEKAFRNVLLIDPQRKEAQEYLDEISRNARGKSIYYLQRAEAFYKRNDYSQALAALDSLNVMQPGVEEASLMRDEIMSAMSVESLFEKGEQEYNQGHFVEAMELFNQVLEKDDDHGSALEMRERCHVRLNELVEEYYNLGIQLYSTERYQSAIEQWEKSLAINPYHKGSLEYIRKARERLKALNELP